MFVGGLEVGAHGDECFEVVFGSERAADLVVDFDHAKCSLCGVIGERHGGVRKRVVDFDPGMLVVLDSLVEPESRGDSMSLLWWTTKSTRVLSAELHRLGHQAGESLVGRMLYYLGYSLQANAKVTEGAQNLDCNA